MQRFDITRTPRRALKVTTGVPAVRRPSTQPPGEELPKHTKQGRGRWLMGCAAGMLIIVSTLFIFSRFVIPFYQRTLDHWRYGEMSVYHTIADIGRGAPSDIYTMESQGNIVVVIVSKDRTEKYQLKLSIGTDTGNMLVLVSLIDVDADGHKDLVLRVDGTDISTVLYNNGSGFQSIPPVKG